MKRPKEFRDLEKQFSATLIAVRDLHVRAMELGVKEIEEAADKAHDALLGIVSEGNLMPVYGSKPVE